MNILSIETSCDETSLALVEAKGGFTLSEVEGLPSIKIKKLLTASQIETHRPWGGVVPNLAKREHAENLPKLFKKLINLKTYKPIDLVAVTVGPGLEPCLWQGIEFAKQIQKEHFPKAVIVPTNHLHGHMYSFLLPQKTNNYNKLLNYPITDYFPAIQLLVSGGHTMLILMGSLTKYKKLGETRDDASGEAFDKVARMLNLPYPGGPEIEKLAKTMIPERSGAKSKDRIVFPRPMIHEKNYDFSFSGLKTAVLYYLRDNKKTKKNEVAASFQSAVIDVLTAKTLRAAKEYNAKSVILSGGVAANSALRSRLRQMSKVSGQMFISAEPKYQGDNAAMIAIAGYITHFRKKSPAPRRSFAGYPPLKAKGRMDI